jgi:hypothetical protein
MIGSQDCRVVTADEYPCENKALVMALAIADRPDPARLYIPAYILYHIPLGYRQEKNHDTYRSG